MCTSRDRNFYIEAAAFETNAYILTYPLVYTHNYPHTIAKTEKKKGGKKKKRSSTAVTTNNSDSDENNINNTALLIDQGEAEFANNTNEPILVANANGDEEAPEGVITLVQQDDNLGEDAIPSAIMEPDQQPQGDVQMFSEDGLAVAMAVDTAAEDEYIYSAIEYDPDSKPPLHITVSFVTSSPFADFVTYTTTIATTAITIDIAKHV